LIAVVAGIAILGGFCYFVAWPYLNPRVDIAVENRSDVAVLVDVEASGGSQPCGWSEVAEPGDLLEIDEVIGGIECFGSEPRSVDFRTFYGQWTCDWRDAKRRQPLVFTIDGPACDAYNIAVSPTPDPRTPGLPFSPPQIGTPPPVTTPTPQ
jgi:hypothetical protein